MGKDKKPPLGERAAKLAREMSRPSPDGSLPGMYDAENERVAKLAKGVEAHEYAVSFTGMCCGAMVMRDGSGDQCGLPYGHSLHVGPPERRALRDAKLEKLAHDAKEASEPLAEIRERTFEFEADGAPGVLMDVILRDAAAQLYTKARAAGHTPVDTTLTVEVTPVIERAGVALKPPRPHVRMAVRAWKAVAL